jgi:hypothetical protein
MVKTGATVQMTRYLITPLIAAGVVAWATPVRALNVGDKAKPFRLQGHDDKWYTLASFKKRILVMFYEGKKSMHQNAWFKKRFTAWYKSGRINSKNVAKIGFANYMESAIPNVVFDLFIKREMKRRFPGDLVLRDRNGTMMRLYGMRNGRSNILIFDRQRRLIWKSSGPLTRKNAKRLLRMIRRLSR